MAGHLCEQCGHTHDISSMEPAFNSPHAWWEISEDERARSKLSNDLCMIFADGTRGFIRAVLPIPVSGRALPVSWGIWVEVDQATWETVLELWKDPRQHEHAPFDVTLANNIPGSPPTAGLPVQLHLTSPTTRPRVEIASDVEHPFAQQQREGVSESQIMAWLHAVGVFG
jgi:hypothetical protein